MISKEDAYVTKGTSVVFRFFKAKDLGTWSLAGAQPKFAATEISGQGIVRNVWADDPAGTKNLRFNVEQEDGTFVVVPVAGLRAVNVTQEDGTVVAVPIDGVERIDP